MKYWRLIASFVLAMVLFLFPLSAQAASSSSITRSVGNDELKGKDYSGQSLIGTEFTNLKLENANFSNADLRGGVFNGSVLEGVNLHGADAHAHDVLLRLPADRQQGVEQIGRNFNNLGGCLISLLILDQLGCLFISIDPGYRLTGGDGLLEQAGLGDG